MEYGLACGCYRSTSPASDIEGTEENKPLRRSLGQADAAPGRQHDLYHRQRDLYRTLGLQPRGAQAIFSLVERLAIGQEPSLP